MPRLVWSPRALSDVDRFYDFLAPKSPDAAERAVKAILDGVEVLLTHPGFGRPFDDTELRELFIPFADGGYFVLYRHHRSAVTLLAMRHSKELGF